MSDTMRKIEETIAEIVVIQKETELSIKEVWEAQKETDARMAKSREETERAIKALSETLDMWAGRLGTSIGTIVELTLIPGIRKKMKDLGHEFENLAPRKLYYRKDGKILTEVDLFLENGVEVMAVEVKTNFNKSAVEYHVNRLKLLRKHETEKLKDKAILGAIAGFTIDEDAEELASQLGMYIIKMVEDDKNIKVIEPAGAVGRW